MSTVLFVKANDRGADQAVSVMLYQAFLDSYKESHPADTIMELDLFREELPYLNAEMINGNFKAARGMQLTISEQRAVNVASKYLEQFLVADKVIFGFPMWNMSLPAVLHTYLDYLNQAGKTFKYTPEGPVGLIPNKKIALLHARGGVYSEGKMVAAEMAFAYIQNIMAFFGVTDFTNVIVEGHHQYRDQADALIADGIAKARKAAVGY
ncbi:FMN-dependent NADH-azoreductase [Paenibacillus nasutitermitis]|uniref:FMN dependent NADH:quinone oxidoreductase n=1 Tax=Paenibacillus nasutitermitis TaxID=1652958 RepID=A0A917E1C3_9BACL|nr:FMN-dependent NADH-azoreductase [Paenibacillus nasutitermitis]GGD88336.1 FMN-dependent NADH-azoreductase 3 [Paenibacillus nasutitermitis]